MAENDAYPMVDGAPLNPYDLPGEPRPSKNVDETPAPTAEVSAPVPGPGDPDATFVEVGGGETSSAGAADPFSVVTEDQAAALKAAGFDTADKIRAASDDELQAVSGVGPAAVSKLREATAS